MTRAFGRLLLISVGVIAWIAFTLFMLRMLGSNQQYTKLEHPLVNQDFLLIAENGDAEHYPPSSLPAFEDAAKISAEVVLGAKVFLTRDEQFVVLPSAYLEDYSEKQGFVRLVSLEELKQLNIGYTYQDEEGNRPWEHEPLRALSLDEFLGKFPDSNILLQIHLKETWVLDNLVELLRKHNPKKRLIVQSTFQGVVIAVKKEEPLLLFAADSASIAKARLFSALFIETMASMSPDIYIAPLEGPQKFSQRLIEEIHRRQKMLVIQTDDATLWDSSWIKAHTNGILTSFPNRFRFMFPEGRKK